MGGFTTQYSLCRPSKLPPEYLELSAVVMKLPVFTLTLIC